LKQQLNKDGTILTSLGDLLAPNDGLRTELDAQELGLILGHLDGGLDALDVRHDCNSCYLLSSLPDLAALLAIVINDLEVSEKENKF
jgi:hypothetical protein